VDSRVNGRRRRALLLAAIGALVVLGIGILIGRGLYPEESNPQDSSSPKTTEDVGPTDVVNGVPIGYTRTEEGAVAAATSFAQTMTGPSGNPDTYRLAMETLAALGWRKRAQELAENAIAFVEDRYGPGGSVEFTPLRYRAARYSDERAVIEIWGVVVGSGPKIAGIEESWITGTVVLSWTGSDWRVIGQKSEGGPTPELLRDGRGGDARAVLQDFQEYEGAPQP
jgi:hypothetical protein